MNQPDATEIRIVRLVLTDLFGAARAKTVSFEQYQRALENGHSWASPLLAVDMWQNLPEDDRLGTGNVTIHPDPDTLTPLPWQPGTSVVLCRAERNGAPAPTPRDVLMRVLESAATAGFEPRFGPELEFTLLIGPDGNGAPFGMNEWFTNDALSRIAPFVDDLYAHLPAMDLPLYEVFNEHGAGQMELNMRPAKGLLAWDRAVLMKLAVKEIAQLHGMQATFMSKPSNDPGCGASGFHVHQTLHEFGGRNVFVPEGSTPSKEAASYVAGQLAHADAITAFAAPTVTSYKRFRPGTWAPMRAGWGFDNRAAMVRIQVDGENSRIENRLGASDANPYLLAAAQLAAGLDGMARQLDPGKPASHNIAEDAAYHLVPTDLSAAVEALEADTVLVDALGEEFCALYASVQRLVWRRYQEHVTDWEIQEYRTL